MRGVRLLILLFFISVSMTAQNWDTRTLKKINSLDNAFVKGYSKAISKSTPYLSVGVPVAIGVYALIDKDRDKLRDAIYIGTTVIEAVAISYVMKHAIDRDRPFERYPDLIHQRDYPTSASFPSGHTASAFSLATSLSIAYPKWYVIAPSALWACSVGFARMNEGVHYPTDVMAGAVIGAGCAVVNVYVNKWLQGLIFPKEKPVLVAY